jgi:hypothetical protein
MAELKPNMQYHWGHDDKFVLDGKEFETVFNTIKAFLSTPESQKVLAIQRAHDTMEQVFAKAIEQGIVKEGPPEEDGPVEKEGAKEVKMKKK